MDSLSDNTLIEAYKRSIDLNLDEDFIELLAEEMKKRNLISIEANN